MLDTINMVTYTRIMGQCMTVSKSMVIEAGRRISDAGEDAKAYLDSYNARRYRHVNTEVTDEEDTNIISYDEPRPDEPVSSLVQGEKEIEKIFEDNSIIDEHI